MKRFCESLREHAMKIFNFKKNKMKLLAKEQRKSYENANICFIYKEGLENKILKDEKYRKLRDHCHNIGEYRGVVHNICN